ncbi:MAG: mechanosensitive ion channel family protein [Bacteroidales bacterium]|nr:mechanosensitive ion channel family protein [Bacteroidales bacterium]
MNRLSKKWLSSDRFFMQLLGAMTHKAGWVLTIVFLLFLINTVFSYIAFKHISPILLVGALTAFALLAFSMCNTLTNIYNLRKNESGITWCQISILIIIGLWIIGVIAIFNIQMTEKNTLVFGVVGGVLAWIFQDKVKGALAFIHLRLHHLLAIDDWIQVPKYHVDGVVNRVSLTTVTIYNWDTTTSTIPISALHSDHFVNLQNMAKGKTYGRQMTKDFILETSMFHPLSPEEAEQLKQHDEVMRYLPEEEIHEGVLNAQLYRLFLYHLLMNHPDISQYPWLIVRWLEPVENGLPLQVYAYIMDGGFASFEWKQSKIMEHIVETLDWFGLRLYQKPSSFDYRLAHNVKEAEQ